MKTDLNITTWECTIYANNGESTTGKTKIEMVRICVWWPKGYFGYSNLLYTLCHGFQFRYELMSQYTLLTTPNIKPVCYVYVMNIIKGYIYIYIERERERELIKNIMILAHVWIENPDMCAKGCWNNQNNNDYTTRMTKYKYMA
jgi:hypothetical protein